MKKLTMARARRLIERELGIKAKELDMPDSYNGNPDFPWYQLKMGNQTITVTYAGGGTFSKGNELIDLTITHENSSAYVSEYFYSDTMEYCETCTEKAKYEVLCDRMGITETDAKLKRLSYEASDAVFRHYHFPARKVEQNLALTVGTLLRINNNSAIYHTYQRFFDYNPSFQNQASHFVFGELPATGTIFKYIGYGKHENGRDAIFVLQDIRTDHVYLYNAADCRKDVTVLGTSDVTTKNIVQSETKTVEAPDQPKAADMLPGTLEQALDEYPLPDPNLTVADLEVSGYLHGDMLPVSKNRALELSEQGLSIYIIEGNSASIALNRNELQSHGGLLAVDREKWEESREFSVTVEDRMKHQEQRESAFLKTSQDAFAIYQMKDGDELRDIRFEPLDWLKSKGVSVDHRNYDLAYTAPLPDKGSTHDRLETLWDRFNNDFPHDFVRPSPSVSDVIALKQNGVVSFHYVDSFGFKEIPGFLKEADIPAPSNILHDIHSESTTNNSTLDSFEGKLLQGDNKFRLMAFDLSGKYFTKSCYEFDIGESELEWWCRKVKNKILSRKDKAAGFTVHVWNEETREWNAYTPDGKHTMTFDTGRRLDGIHESLHQEINFPVGPESNEISDVEQEEMEEGPELEM